MQCPECGHKVANGRRTECVYCGAALGGGTFTENLDSLKKGQLMRFSSRFGEDGTICEVIEERKEYGSLDDVPGDWREKIEKAIRRGGENISPDSSVQEQEIFSVFSHAETPRRKRLHPFILALIFFASAGVVGIVLWLLT